MSQNLPITPPQVEEVQGGVRLTPLGLSQLEGDANAVGLPRGVVPALADPGNGATTTAVARAAATPAVYVIDVPNAANSTTTNYAMPVGLTGVSAGFLVTDIKFIKTGGDGAGGTNTIQVLNGSSAITDASSFASKVDTTATAAATYNDDYLYVQPGGSLVVQLIKAGSGNAAHRVVVTGLLITQ